MWAGFASSLLLVTVAEFGDKTFFTPLILAMRHPRRWVFLGTWLALAVMTLLAVVAGKVLFKLLPPLGVRVLSAGVFAAFGLRMLWQAYKMTPQNPPLLNWKPSGKPCNRKPLPLGSQMRMAKLYPFTRTGA